MLLIYGNEELWSSFPGDEHRTIAETDALHEALRGTGEFVCAFGVGDQAWPRRCTSPTARRSCRTGPYIETKEYLGSFDIIDVDSEERALEIAARCRSPGSARVEVRPIMHEAPGHCGPADPATEDLLRPLAPQVLGALVRRYGTSTPARTRSRRRCWRRRGSGRATAAPTTLAPGWSRWRPPPDRPPAQRRSPPAARRPPTSPAAPTAVTPRRRRRRGDDDSLALLILCCHPSAVRGVTGRAHAARGGRTHHRGDRERVPRAGGDDGAAHQSGQAAHPRRRGDLRAAPAGRAGRAAPRSSAGALPDLQRGVRRLVRRRPQPRRSHRRGDPSRPPAAPALPEDPRSPVSWRSCC